MDDQLDTQSARNREVEINKIEKASWLSKNVGPVLAIVTVSLTFILFYMILFKDISETSKQKDILIYILGVLSAIVTQIFSYYFGSSAGSKDKMQILKNTMNGQENANKNKG